MRFDSYPLDVQHCPFQVGSYGHNDSYMSFKLVNLKRDTFQSISVLDYTDMLKNLSNDVQLYVGDYGKYTLTGFTLELARKSFPYIVKFYLPSGLFVMVSWVISQFLGKGPTNKTSFLVP